MNGSNAGFTREDIARETDGWLLRLHLTSRVKSGWMGPVVGNRKRLTISPINRQSQLKVLHRDSQLISPGWTLKNTPMPLTLHQRRDKLISSLPLPRDIESTPCHVLYCAYYAWAWSSNARISKFAVSKPGHRERRACNEGTAATQVDATGP